MIMGNKQFTTLTNKSKEELLKELQETQRKLMVEKAKLSSGISSENPSIIRKYKRQIARIKMLLYQKHGLSI